MSLKHIILYLYRFNGLKEILAILLKRKMAKFVIFFIFYINCPPLNPDNF